MDDIRLTRVAELPLVQLACILECLVYLVHIVLLTARFEHGEELADKGVLLGRQFDLIHLVDPFKIGGITRPPHEAPESGGNFQGFVFPLYVCR